jgi:hypothetical protein
MACKKSRRSHTCVTAASSPECPETSQPSSALVGPFRAGTRWPASSFPARPAAGRWAPAGPTADATVSGERRSWSRRSPAGYPIAGLVVVVVVEVEVVVGGLVVVVVVDVEVEVEVEVVVVVVVGGAVRG